MPKPKETGATLEQILKQVTSLRRIVAGYEARPEDAKPESDTIRRFVNDSGLLLAELRELREAVSPVHFGAIGITLGRSDGIAKFFAFSFVNQPKRPLNELTGAPFYGSGVYAIYSGRRPTKSSPGPKRRSMSASPPRKTPMPRRSRIKGNPSTRA